MSNVRYHLSEGEHINNVTAFFPDRTEPIKLADSNHPHWQSIVQGLRSGDESVYELFDVRGGIGSKLRRLSDRVTYNGEKIFFDGDEVDDALAQQVIRFLDEGIQDWEPLVKFWEKISQNPSEHSRDNLYRWLRTHAFAVTLEGDIVGYKAVTVVGNTDATREFRSVHAGPAIVDGVAVNGNVPNNPGAVVEMARSKVTADPSIGCHVGLHVGTHAYATDFGKHNNTSVILEVHVHPRDVVSVPTDCSDAKMRVSKYTVVDVIGKPYKGAVLAPAEDYAWKGDVGYAVV
jgi:hypothetical protein